MRIARVAVPQFCLPWFVVVLAAQDPAEPPAPPTAEAVVKGIDAAYFTLFDRAAKSFQAQYLLKVDDRDAGEVQIGFGRNQAGKIELRIEKARGECEHFDVLESILPAGLGQSLLLLATGGNTRVFWTRDQQGYELQTHKPSDEVLSQVREVTTAFAMRSDVHTRMGLGKDEYEFTNEKLPQGLVVTGLRWTMTLGPVEGSGCQVTDFRFTWGDEAGEPFVRGIDVKIVRSRHDEEIARYHFALALATVLFQRPDGTLVDGKGKTIDRATIEGAGAPAAPLWDELAQQVVPKVLAANVDGSALPRYARAYACDIDLSIVVQGGAPSAARLHHHWEDGDDNGVIAPDEAAVETTFVGNPAIRRFLPEVKKALLAQGDTGPLALFRGARVQAVEVDGGYKLKIDGGGKVGKGDDAAHVVTYLTIAKDLRVVRMRSVDETHGHERVFDFQSQRLGELWAVTSYTLHTTTAEGAETTDTCRLAYDTRGRVPLVQRMTIGTVVAAPTGRVEIRQDYTIRDCKVQWRDQPLPPPGANDDEAAFAKKAQPKAKAEDEDKKLFPK